MKSSWQDRYNAIVSDYPSVGSIDWSSALKKDPDLFARILGDVLKAEGRGSTPGKRPNLDRDQAYDQFKKFSLEDFSEYNFLKAFNSLASGRSVRNIANKTGLGKSYVHRLLKGEVEPTFYAMEQIAKGFNKQPSYFLEYRIAHVLYSMETMLSSNPEMATSWYLKIKGY